MIKVSGINLSYEKSGNGDALILLHGNGEDYSIFAPLLQKFLQNCIAIQWLVQIMV